MGCLNEEYSIGLNYTVKHISTIKKLDYDDATSKYIPLSTHTLTSDSYNIGLMDIKTISITLMENVHAKNKPHAVVVYIIIILV